MTGPTHVIIATVATLALRQQTDFAPTDLLAWLMVWTGALLPDIDEPSSTITEPLNVVDKMVPDWVEKTVHSPIKAVSSAIREVFGHRGATHYVIWPVMLLSLGYWQNNDVIFWLGWGYLWHVLADWTTRRAIPAAGPFSRKAIHILPRPLRIRTGGPVEALISTACWLYVFYSIYLYYVGTG
jgi:inner membrane protein